MVLDSLPGLNAWTLLKIPEKASIFTICFEEPKRVFLRERQVVTLLHHPPPCILEEILEDLFAKHAKYNQ